MATSDLVDANVANARQVRDAHGPVLQAIKDLALDLWVLVGRV